MCLLLVAVECFPDWPLVLLGNRDEFHTRASAVAAPWREAADVVGGRDLVAHGSWLAQRNDGRFAAVTNLRSGLPASAPRSRGALVRDFVVGADEAGEYAERIVAVRDQFGPFNLVLGEAGTAWLVEGASATCSRLARGVHVLSNGPGLSDWPKARRLRERFVEATRRGLADDKTLLGLLADRWQPADADLPDTGVGAELERLLAPVYITGTRYGTRASTLVLHHVEEAPYLRERSFGADGQVISDVAWRCSPEGEWVPAEEG
ncbi:NRDE family protein [Dokdonella sp.]|uniref:NRDE family protein n=1 Tax=Dokdonella sp. TaxID=2291710 RepID=UPI0025C44C0B|nr:NRDE family protein [Dokdonella sp.]MBX3690624.1 NRDE family protein [Dokdonella sp.]MCW5567631.1 NRDE family protein [Dokdonella sp.]